MRAAKASTRRSTGGASPIGSAFGTSRTTSGSAANASRHAQHAARGREQQALGQQLARQALAPRAERRAHRELLAPLDSARQQQAREVGAGDQQHGRARLRRAPSAAAATAARAGRAGASRSRPTPLFSRGYCCSSCAVTSVHLGARRVLERHAGPQPCRRSRGTGRRGARSRRASKRIGSQSCVSRRGKWKPRGITPITWYGSSSSSSLRPTTRGLAAEALPATARSSAAACPARPRGRPRRRRSGPAAAARRGAGARPP